MILVNSGAYIDKELQTIFGKIPPSFLPVKNKRLFVLQSELLGNHLTKYITIPEDFIIDDKDLLLLNQLNYTIVKNSKDNSLGETIAKVLIDKSGLKGGVIMLHGDTLYSKKIKLNKEEDCLILSEFSDYYDWKLFEENVENRQTLSGYFSFSNVQIFLSCLFDAKFNFEHSISLYSKKMKDVKYILEDSWLDFGHYNTYFRSKSLLTSERSFNNLAISNMKYLKSSSQSVKMIAEAHWFESLPEKLRIYTPHFLGRIEQDNKKGYEIEYLFNATLSELYVFGKLPLFVWEGIVNSSINLINTFYEVKNNKTTTYFSNAVIAKTNARLEKLKDFNIDIWSKNYLNAVELPSLVDIVNEISLELEHFNKLNSSLIHGDFCFSNILFDFKSQLIKVIDPRGLSLNGEISVEGSIMYDLAKFYHSIIGMYDFIIAGYFDINVPEKNVYQFEIHDLNKYKDIQSLFLKKEVLGINMNDRCMQSLNIHLFLSMIPLHSDSKTRMDAFIANALRLYINFKKK